MQPSTTFHAGLLAALILPAALAITGCLTDDKEDSAGTPGGGAMVFTLNSDYKTGSYSALGLEGMEARKDIDAVGPDARVRYFGGKDIFVLNRLGRDNAQVIDRENLKTVLQFSFPPLSNPYDMVLEDSLVYVGFYNLPKVLVYGQSQGDLRDSIDISAYADTADGKPEVADLAIDGGMLYILCANLDSKNDFAPLQARLVRVKLSDKSVTALDLPIGQPENMALDKAAGKLYIPCHGVFFKPDYTLDLDGGVIEVGLADFKVGETLATEAGLGGGVNTALFHDGKLYMDLSTGAAEKIVSFPPSKGAEVATLLTLESFQYGGMDVDREAGILYVGDRKDGLRIYDLAAKEEKAGSKVILGALPILDLALIK